MNADPPGDSNLKVAAELAVFLVAFCIYLYLVGLIADWVRLSAARLPANAVTGLPAQRVFADGLRLTALTAVVFAILCVIAWLTPAPTWSKKGPEWHKLVAEHGASAARNAAGESKAPIGDIGVRLVAGFNIAIIAGIVAALGAFFGDEVIGETWAVVVFALAGFALTELILTRWGPLTFHARLHGAVWFAITAVALFTSAPLAVLVLTGVGLSTLGRAGARLTRPDSPRALLRSPLPWLLFLVVALIGFAYEATPPASFPGARVTMTSGTEESGGYLADTSAGVYLATCTRKLDGTAKEERVRLLPRSEVKRVVIGGPSSEFDSGQRPSLGSLGLKALGLDASLPTLVSADLRARRPACGSGQPEVSPTAELLQGSGPASGQARGGEPPIERINPQIAPLARLYQPTMYVPAADRFWPVSVGAVLAERGPTGRPPCLVRAKGGELCSPSPSDLTKEGSASDYLQLPVRLAPNPSPELQFQAFERGQEISPGPTESWLAEPRVLKPWLTAEMYFYYAHRLNIANWPGGTDTSGLPSTVDALEYWFYYPYNYFPARVRPYLMAAAPIAADRTNVDFHQGDWEHIDVLLSTGTETPIALYMARHSNEGIFVPWSSAVREAGQTHPVVQAAFGGHPTYPPGCGRQARQKQANALSDWLVCGPTFVFAAKSTPLVDMGREPWACWAGYFGEAKPGIQVANAKKSEIARESLGGKIAEILRKGLAQILAAGPKAPLLQAENKGICTGGDPSAR